GAPASDHAGRTPPAPPPEPGDPGRPRDDRPEGDEQGPGIALRHGARPGRRPAPLPRPEANPRPPALSLGSPDEVVPTPRRRRDSRARVIACRRRRPLGCDALDLEGTNPRGASLPVRGPVAAEGAEGR